jgi:hypothetical protein
MSGAARAIRQLEAASCSVRLLPDGRVRITGPGNPPQPPPPDLLEFARQHRDGIAQLLADRVGGPEAAPDARPEPPPPRPATRPGALKDDPPAPVVDPDASCSLTVLELAGAGPHLTADGRLEITHPTRVTPAELATAQQHQAGISALLRYRELMEQTHAAGGHAVMRFASRPLISWVHLRARPRLAICTKG